MVPEYPWPRPKITMAVATVAPEVHQPAEAST